MKRSYRFYMSILLLGAFLLSACSGTTPSQDDSAAPGSPASQFTEVVFTGTVQSMGGGEWTISGQSVGVDGSTALDANIQVGDIVTVEAQVSQDGKVFALKIESSLPDDTSANANDANANDANANTNDNTNTGDDNGNANSNDDNSNANGNDNSAPAGPEQEILGAVQAITKDTITIDGVTYQLANFTEFKTPIVVGDQVKIHLIVNADGTLTIREIEKTTGTGVSTNNNGNSNDDSSNSNGDDSNSNDNSNDDNSGGGDSNSNDDNSGGGNSNDDDGGDDNNSNDNG